MIVSAKTYLHISETYLFINLFIYMKPFKWKYLLSCCLILPSDPAPLGCDAALSIDPHSTEKTKLIFAPSSFLESCYIEILRWVYHTRIFSWSAQMEHARSLLIKLSAVGPGVLKTAVSSGVMR